MFVTARLRHQTTVILAWYHTDPKSLPKFLSQVKLEVIRLSSREYPTWVRLKSEAPTIQLVLGLGTQSIGWIDASYCHVHKVCEIVSVVTIIKGAIDECERQPKAKMKAISEGWVQRKIQTTPSPTSKFVPSYGKTKL